MTSQFQPERCPLISVIIATRERPESLRKCLSHVFVQDYSAYEVIVIDNSPNDQCQKVVTEFVSARHLKGSHRTDNVASLRNIAISNALGDILAFIDDDTYVTQGWLNAFATVFIDPAVGGATGRVITPGVLEENSSNIARLSPSGEYVGSSLNNTWPQIVEVDHLPGCNMAVRRAMIKQLGGFDPLMHFSREDIELGLRIKAAGYRLVFQPAAVVHHALAPRPTDTVRRTEHDLRSRFIHCRSFTYLFVRYYGLRFDFAKTAFWRLPRQDWANLLRVPSFSNFQTLSVTFGGIAAGYVWAGLAKARMHRVPYPLTQ